MASKAHCAYCFETLSANLENRPALTLQQVQDLWTKYTSESESAAADEEEEDSPSAAEEDSTAPNNNPPDEASPRPAAVSRLLAPSPASTSSSSVQSSSSSSPSGLSAASSSATSKSSSRTSLVSSTKATAQTATPLFVTWNTIARSNGTPLDEKRLRGCIGTFEAQELDRGLRQYAIISALQDTRFPPISARELPTLEVGVTLLTDFEPAADPMDWTLGTHGLRLSFTYHGRRYGSTYLPDVAKEQGWTKEETIVSLMRKAGWSGKREEWRGVELGVVRYQGRQVKLGWGEWRGWREWVDGEEEGEGGSKGGRGW